MRVFIGLFLLTVLVNHAAAVDTVSWFQSPRISIIIDDLGDRLKDGRRVIDLPGQVTVGIMPYTPFAKRLASYAGKKNKEVMLHLPMESIGHKFLGKAGLTSSMSKQEFFDSLKESLNYINNIRGVNNHMGSQLTQNRHMMNWLMQGLSRHGNLYFVDSRTIDTSHAEEAARAKGLANASRDVFLDHTRDLKHIYKQWKYMINYANENGSALAIAHPYPETIKFLDKALADLEQENIKLVPVSELIRWRKNRGKLAWHNHTSSSH
jgi:polysaccharide deacetylase 2 family uncharacterized protein YibQ